MAAVAQRKTMDEPSIGGASNGIEGGPRMVTSGTSPRQLRLPMSDAPPRRRRVNIGDVSFRALTSACALVVPLVLVSLFAVLVFESSDAIRQFSWRFFVTAEWDP